ncbi:MAG: hypothetical protein IPN34_13765 [Planctomycetes bacterium]|nr:hypothetical protein [Planctomycetota bacterium]
MWHRILHERTLVLPPSLFFCTTFHLIALVWPRSWAVPLWLLVLCFGYTLAPELLRALGQEELLRMIFLSPSRR